MLSLALCHNVTHVKSENSDTQTEYQASNPDEIALVKFAEEMKCKLIYRDQVTMIIETPMGKEDTYEILLDFPFSSENRRMGIILRHTDTDRIFFLMKGAESTICQKVSEEDSFKIKEAAENLSLEGLRVLAFSQKLLSESQYKCWRREYDSACAADIDREQQKMKIREELENNSQYVGLAGIEDRLQEDVTRVVEGLKQAGIKVWMLTGDKIETACCIGISSGLKSRTEKYIEFKNVPNIKQELNVIVKLTYREFHNIKTLCL